jgi:hypothetical protein
VSVVAVDWSGRRTGERRHLWTAEAHDGELIKLEAGRKRGDVVDGLVARGLEPGQRVALFRMYGSSRRSQLTYTCPRLTRPVPPGRPMTRLM